MPTTPWIAGPTASPTGEVHIVVTEFQLPRLRDTLGFLRATREITTSMRAAEGLVGHALQARILARTYRTVSAWRSADDARRFARSGAHGRIAGAAAAGSHPTALGRWDAPASDPPPSWERVEEALKAPSIGVTPPPGAGVGSRR